MDKRCKDMILSYIIFRNIKVMKNEAWTMDNGQWTMDNGQ